MGVDGGRGTRVVRAHNRCPLSRRLIAARVDRRWQDLRNALAGLFCASLGSLDDLRTTSPALTFQPEGSIPNFTHPHRLRHATLPSEHVCTENLTPFLKLLPCKSRSGIASLLNPHRLFDADWHGLGVHVRYRENLGVEVRLAFQAVFDPVRQSHDKRRGASRVLSSPRCTLVLRTEYPFERPPFRCLRTGTRPWLETFVLNACPLSDWSLQSVFDRRIERACPVAQSSKVRVALPQDAPYSITPEATTIQGDIATYDVTTGESSAPASS